MLIGLEQIPIFKNKGYRIILLCSIKAATENVNGEMWLCPNKTLWTQVSLEEGSECAP